MANSSIRNYVRSFANPLLAMAFKDGIDYVGDPDFRALEPKKEGDMWEVIVEHEVEDDDEEVTPIGPVPAKNHSQSNTITDTIYGTLDKNEKKHLTLKDYEAKLDKMKPRPIPATGNDEVIHPPVKIEEKLFMPTEPTKPKQNLGYNQSAIEGIKPCNSCLNCVHGETCINIINAACLASMPM